MKLNMDLPYYTIHLGMCLLFLAISSQIAAQEDVKRINRDSVRVETGTQGEVSVSPLPLDEISKVPLPQPTAADSLFRLSLDKPLVPPYYMNPSPMFRGDYSTGGVLGEFRHGILYGTGGQTTLPGIGQMNEASLGYMHRFNSQWSFQVGVDALKMNMPFAVGQSFGTSGTLMYRPSDRIAFKVFGSYYRGQTYGMESHSYGGSVTVGMSDRFSVEMGVQRRYNPLRGGWETVPIVTPCYKFNKFDLGIDVGGILYEILHKVVIDKDRKMGNPTIGAPSHFQMQGR